MVFSVVFGLENNISKVGRISLLCNLGYYGDPISLTPLLNVISVYKSQKRKQPQERNDRH